MTDREWRASHCIECWPPPDHCTNCPCHEPPCDTPGSEYQHGKIGVRKAAPAGNRGLTNPTVEESKWL